MSQYYSLISSLPALKMGETPSITEDAFMLAASAFVSVSNMEILEKFALVPSDDAEFAVGSLAGQYTLWERALRNSLVKIRASKRTQEALANMRGTDFECDADRAASQAYSAANPLERERVLDNARIAKLDELSACQVFSFDMICAYKIKLAIMWKWSDYRSHEKASANLERTVTGVLEAYENKSK